jgi:hypothetical protein
MRPFADFVNATMSFRAPLLDRACCRVSRKYFFRNFLPAQWICYGDGSKRTFLNSHSIAIELSARGVREPFRQVSCGQDSPCLTIIPTDCDSRRPRLELVGPAVNHRARSRGAAGGDRNSPPATRPVTIGRKNRAHQIATVRMGARHFQRVGRIIGSICGPGNDSAIPHFPPRAWQRQKTLAPL